MIITAISSAEGRRIIEYRGIITGEAILGATVSRDLFAGIRDSVGGRSGAYERSLREARETALQEMETEAARPKGDAGCGMDLEYEVIGKEMAG